VWTSQFIPFGKKYTPHLLQRNCLKKVFFRALILRSFLNTKKRHCVMIKIFFSYFFFFWHLTAPYLLMVCLVKAVCWNFVCTSISTFGQPDVIDLRLILADENFRKYFGAIKCWNLFTTTINQFIVLISKNYNLNKMIKNITRAELVLKDLSWKEGLSGAANKDLGYGFQWYQTLF
jgi:hypothetical protein